MQEIDMAEYTIAKETKLLVLPEKYGTLDMIVERAKREKVNIIAGYFCSMERTPGMPTACLRSCTSSSGIAQRYRHSSIRASARWVGSSGD